MPAGAGAGNAGYKANQKQQQNVNRQRNPQANSPRPSSPRNTQTAAGLPRGSSNTYVPLFSAP